MLMVVLIISIMLVVAGLIGCASMIRRIKSSTAQEYGRQSAIIACTSAACLVVGLFCIVINCGYIQPVGEARVLVSMTGSIQGTEVREGLKFKSPWVSTVVFNTRNIVVEYRNPDPNGGKLTEEQEKALAGTAIGANDADGALAQVDITVNLSLDPSRVEEVYRKYQNQDNFHERVIKNDVRSIVRSTVVKYSTADLRPQRDAVATKITEELESTWASQGLIVESVRLHNISYSGDIEASLVAVQTARNEADKAQANLETSKISAEKTRVDALAQADADQIIRCGATTTTEKAIINGKEVDVVKTVPLQGESCQNRLNEQVLRSKYYDTLREVGKDGNLIIVEGDSTPLINIDQKPKIVGQE